MEMSAYCLTKNGKQQQDARAVICLRVNVFYKLYDVKVQKAHHLLYMPSDDTSKVQYGNSK